MTGAFSGEGNNGGKYRAKKDEGLESILARIREDVHDKILLDITDHKKLRVDGALRRTLVSAAKEYQKQVTFTFMEPDIFLQKKEKKTKPAASKPRHVPVSGSSRKKREQDNQPFKKGLALSVPRMGGGGKKVALTFAFLTGALAAAAFFFLVPQAEIRIVPVSEPVSLELGLRADTGSSHADPNKGSLPARVISAAQKVETVYEVRHMDQRGEKASGQVKLVNRTGTVQEIKEKSRLKAENGMVYEMEKYAVIPPGGSTRVEVTAKEGGNKGNIKEGKLTFVALPDTAQKIIYGEVAQPLAGGTDKEVAVLSREDIAEAKKKTRENNIESLREEIEEKVEGKVLRDPKLTRSFFSDVIISNDIGEEVESFSLRGNLHFEFIGVRKEELFSLVKRMTLLRAGENKILYEALPEDMGKVVETDWDKGRVEISAKVENVAGPDFDLQQLRERLAGRTKESAEEYLNTFE